MARTVPASFQHVSFTAIGAGGATQAFPFFRDHLLNFRTEDEPNTPIWEIYSQVGDDIVFHSRGDRRINNGAGDASIYIRLDVSVDTQLLNFSISEDWSSLSHTGADTTGAFTAFLNGSADIWMGVDEYSLLWVQSTPSFSNCYWLGQLVRDTLVPAHQSGVCFATGAAAGGPTVTVDVDRDISGTLTAGQQIWWRPQTQLGDALEAGTTVVSDLVSIPSATQLEITATAIPANAIIGLRPQHLMRSNGFTGTTVIRRLDGTTLGGGVTVLFEPGVGAIHQPTAGTNVTHITPFNHTSTLDNLHNLGTLTMLHAASGRDLAIDTFTGGVIRANYNDDWKFWVFPNIQVNGAYTICLGPLGPGF